MKDSTRWLGMAALLLGGWLLYLLGPVLTPFLAGAALAYLGDPLADRLEALNMPRTVAVTVVFTSLMLLGILGLLMLLPMLERQLGLLINKMPGFIDWLQNTGLPWVAARTGLKTSLLSVEQLKPALSEHWQDAGMAVGTVLKSLSSSGVAILGWFGNMLLIPVVAFYLLRDWDHLLLRCRDLLPRSSVGQATQIARECDEVISAFVRGQLLVMLGLGCVYATGLWMVGLEVALLIGFIAGLASIVPYLGFIVGLIVGCIAAFMQFQDWMPLLYVLLVFGVGQLIEGFVLQPWLIGDKVGLHPVVVIFAVLAGGQLFGFVGVLLALPAAAVIKVFLAHAHERYLRSSLYSQTEVVVNKP